MRAMLVAAAAAAVVVLVPGSTSASGCTVSWDGGASGAWTTPENWDDDTLPDAADHVCINGPAAVTLGTTVVVDHYTVGAGATLSITAATLRAEHDSENAGTIVLDGAGAKLSTEDGAAETTETLTNTGAITSTGTGGEQEIAGDLVNGGTLTVGHELLRLRAFAEPRSPKLTNAGQLTATDGGHLIAISATLMLSPSGTVSGPGVVDADTGARLEVAGGTIDANADLNVTGGSGNCCGNAPGGQLAFVGGTPTGTIGVSTNLGGRHALIGDVPAGVTVELEADGVLVAAGDWTNAGTVRLSGANAALLTENGVNTDVETLTNTGTVATTGSGTSRTLGGDILNQAQLTIGHPDTRFVRADDNRQSKLTNTGTLAVTEANRLVFLATTLVQATGGTISGPGLVDVETGGRLEIAGGTIDGTADVNAIGGSGNCCGNAAGAHLVFADAADATGAIGVSSSLGGLHALTGDVPAGITLDLEASGVLVATADWTNAGTIRLSGPASALRTENGTPFDVETLTNTGVVDITGPGAIGGDVANQGELSARHPGAVFARADGNRQSTLTNTGALGATAGNRLRFDATTLVLQDGGTVTGPGAIDVDTFGRLEVAGGTIDAGADLNATGGSGNCCGNSPAAALAFTDPAATGAFDVLSTLGGTHALTGDIPAGISLHVFDTRLSSAAPLTNAGHVRLGGSGTLAVTAPETLTNTGTLAGDGAIAANLVNDGELEAMQVNGTFEQTPDGALTVEAPGSAGSTLAVTGAAALDGELRISTGAPPPAVGQTHNAVTSPARSGTFANVVGRAEGPWAVLYQSPGVVLQAVPPGGTGPELSVEPAEVVEGDSGTADLAFTARLSEAADHPVTVEWHTVDDTATSPSDFTEASGLVSFAAGETEKTITVAVKGDTDLEPGEELLVRLRGPHGAELGVARAAGLIVSDDLGVSASTPDRAGDGTVTMVIRGGGFAPGTSVKLQRAGQPDQPGTVVATDRGRSRLVARFALADAALGVWDLVVTGPGGASATRLGALTVEAARPPQLSVSVSAPGAIRFGWAGRATISVHNSGNTDAAIEQMFITGRNVTLRLEEAATFADPPLAVDAATLAELFGGAAVVPGGETRSVVVRFKSTDPTAHAPLSIEAEVTPAGLADLAAPDRFPDQPAGKITGRLQTPAGAGVPGVVVSAATAPGGAGGSAAAITGPDGEFTLAPLPDGTYSVAVGDEPTGAANPATVVVGPGSPAPDIVITEAIAAVSGTLRTPAGARVGRASVALLHDGRLVDQTQTDAAGRYRFAVLGSDTYVLEAKDRDGRLARRDGVAIEAGTPLTGVDLTTGDRQIDVTVTGPGGPVEGARVRARSGAAEVLALAHTDAAGHATLALPPGPATVHADAEGLAPDTAEVDPAPGTTPVALDLGAGGTIEGQITVGGVPADFGRALIVERGSRRAWTSPADDSGEHSFTGLGPGTYDVWLTAPAAAPELVTGVVLGAGATATADGALDEDGQTYSASLKMPGGALAVDALFTVRHRETGARLSSSYAGPSGVTELGPLGAGTYDVEVTRPGTPVVVEPLAVARSARRADPLPLEIDGLPPGTVPNPPIPELKPERPPRSSLGVEEPRKFPWHRDGHHLDYIPISWTNPCPRAQRLFSRLTFESGRLNFEFDLWYESWVDLSLANNAEQREYLATAAKILSDAVLLAKAVKGIKAAVDGTGEILESTGSAFLDSLVTAGSNYQQGTLPGGLDAAGGAVNVAGIYRALEQAKPLDGVKGDWSVIHNQTGAVLDALNILKDLAQLWDKAKEFPDQVRQRGDRYLAAQDRYLRKLLLVYEMTNELKRIAPLCPEDPNDPPPPPSDFNPPRGPSGSWHGESVIPDDPNDILGPAGVGAERWIPADQDLPYTIRFENKPTAGAPAVLVRVETQLDPDVDLDAFELGDVGWGDVLVPVPGGRESYHADVPLADGDLVRVDGALDRPTRTVRWTLATIDPATGEYAEEATAGFLPPEDGTGRGQGFVSYGTRAAPDVLHGTEIAAAAEIVFDFNAPIDTPEHRNAIDAAVPQSAVASVTQAAGPGCTDALDVTWAGTDSGSGIDVFDLWVSTDGGPFVPWLLGATATAATYDGSAGHEYAFYSVARDRVGATEAAPDDGGDAQRAVACDRTPPETLFSVEGPAPVNGFHPGPVEVRLEGVDGPGGAGVDRLAWSATGATPGGATVDADETTVPVAGEGQTVIEAASRDAAGNQAAARTIAIRIDTLPPGVAITSPAEGAQVPAGSGATADFTCADGGSGMASCTGSVADGGPIDGGSPGPRTLTVTAVDKAGRRTEVTRSFTVVRGTPRLSVRPVAVSLGKARKGRAKLVIRNREAFAIGVRARAIAAKKAKALSNRAGGSIAAGKAKAVKLKFGKAARKALARKRKLKARVEVKVTGPAGDARTVRTKVTVRAAKR